MDRFTASLSARIADLEQRLIDVSATPSAETAEALAIALHGLAGIGGTYGHAQVSEIAGESEAVAWQSMENGGPDGAALEMFASALLALRRYGRECLAVSGAEVPA